MCTRNVTLRSDVVYSRIFLALMSIVLSFVFISVFLIVLLLYFIPICPRKRERKAGVIRCSYAGRFPTSLLEVGVCWQSCVASKYLDGLLLSALHDPSLSQQAAVFHQHKLLRQNAVTTNATRGTAMKTVDAKLHVNSTVCLPVY